MNDIGAALIAAVGDLWRPLMLLFSVVFYLLAAAAFLQGCLRVLKHSEDGGGGPSVWGTAVSFLIAVVLLWLPEVMSGGIETFFAQETVVRANLGYGARGENYDRLLGAVFAIVNIVGLLAFVRGIFVLRAASDGVAGATAGGAALHMLGGLMGWHILGVLKAVQGTLGITVLKIT